MNTARLLLLQWGNQNLVKADQDPGGPSTINVRLLLTIGLGSMAS